MKKKYKSCNVPIGEYCPKHGVIHKEKLVSKKNYQVSIMVARGELKKGKVIEAYDILGRILEDMEK